MQNNSKLLAFIVTMMFAFIYNSLANAAGFNCKSKNLSSIETYICSNSDLSRFDDSLNAIFKDALRESNKQGKQQLINEQRQWIMDVRNKCSENQFSCLKKAYNSRYAELTNTYSKAMKNRMLDYELSELSRRSGYSNEEIKEVLGNCNKNNWSMKTCSYLFSLHFRVSMDSALAQKLEVLPLVCRDKLQSAQKQWEENMQSQCNKEAQEEFGDGSYTTLSYNSCMELGIKARTAQIQSIKSCE
jgi:uncharacterized protein